MKIFVTKQFKFFCPTKSFFMVFYGNMNPIAKLFFLSYRFRNTYERNESNSLKNCHVKILVL
jgi:hypothetical protein